MTHYNLLLFLNRKQQEKLDHMQRQLIKSTQVCMPGELYQFLSVEYKAQVQ